MKFLLPLLATLIAVHYSFAQTNTFPGTGNVGIGTISQPTADLQIGYFSKGGSSAILIPGTYNFEQLNLGQLGNGNMAMEWLNHSGSLESYGIKFLVDTDHGLPGLQLQYAPPALSYGALSYQTGLYMNLAGNIAIGTTDAKGYKLAVNGAAIATSMTVKAFGNWPDYVFQPTYDLPTLAQVKTYIDKNHHLPEMPTAEQVEKDGLNVGDFNAKLLKKVEQLTLYLIEKDKIISDQQRQLTSQQEQINLLRQQLELITKKLK